ncbi:MAG: prolipoprotein diacylglyceryl transferase [Clostridiales bacterium]|jgi:phosphatidylglycerol:prolipoprotein diacylglycerol transferase|nr:prolipoprotein diacylglyceryl transferase [Clostridiales bacterium]
MYDNYAISFPSFGISVNPSRVAFVLFGKEIYWYGVLIAVGFVIGMIYIYKRCRRFGIVEDDFANCLIIGVPSAVIVARIYYVVFNYSAFRGDFWSLFKIWEGGLAMFGVILGAVLAVVIYCRVKKIKAAPILDLTMICLILAQAIGRWGNFLNREAFGVLPPNTPAFLRNILDYFTMNLTSGDTVLPVQPTFLYESVWDLIGFFVLHFYSYKRKYDGQIFLLYFAWYGFGRFFIESLRADSLYLFDTGIRVSQLVAGAVCIVSIAVMVYIRVRIKPDPSRMAVAIMERKKAEALDAQQPSAETAAPAAEEIPEAEEVPEAKTEITEKRRARNLAEAKARMIAEARELGLLLDDDGSFIAQVDPQEMKAVDKDRKAGEGASGADGESAPEKAQPVSGSGDESGGDGSDS